MDIEEFFLWKMGVKMIKIKNLKKQYATGVVALENIDLEVEKGDVFGIIGLSGAGKSTLVRCINRLEEGNEGEIEINGIDIRKLGKKELREQRSKIGMIFQNFNLLGRKSVAENIAFPLEIAKIDKASMQKRVEELLDLVGLQDKKNAYPSQLSGGQKQRVAIARALANNCEILLCDEATSALDPSTTQNILSLIKELNQKLGITVVVITHQMEVIQELCNKVAVIAGGHIVEQGSAYTIFSKPKANETRILLGKDREKELPSIVRNQIADEKLFRLTFDIQIVSQPIISHIIESYKVKVNIYEGHIQTIQGQTFGQLLIGISGAEKDRIRVIQYFEDIKLEYEEVEK